MTDSLGMQNLSLDSPVRPPLARRQDEGLYSAVAGGKVSLQQLVSDWVEDYQKAQDPAMVSLVQLFITASGCNGQITQQMMETMEQGDIINLLAEDFDMAAQSYPILGHGAAAKKLRGNLNDFIILLVKKTQNSILYDQVFMDNLVSLLTVMSASQVRPFRHTATLASMSLMTALANVWTAGTKLNQNLQEYLERESRRPSDQKGVEKMEMLTIRLEELEKNKTELQEMLSYMFRSIFVHRYRDVVEDIRSLCLTELGVWMTECPDLFLEDSYLKYLGWPLSDKAESVRLCTIKSLLPLYNDGNIADKMALFTEKFKSRLVSMTLDRDIDVSVCAIQIIQAMARYQRDILTDEEVEKVYLLVFSAHRPVARAAGKFLQNMLFTPSTEEQQQVRTKSGKMRLPNTPSLRNLVQFYMESDKAGYEAHLLDSLADFSMVRDWECMTDLLVEECGLDEEDFDYSQETAMVVLMVESIKQAVSGETPVGRGSVKRVHSGKEMKQMAIEKGLVTTHFMTALPILVHKYLLDQEMIVKLLSIIQWLDCSMYTTSRQEKALGDLLKLLLEVVDKHTEEGVLDEAFKALAELCCPESSSHGRCQPTRDQLLQSAATELRKKWADFDESSSEEELERDATFSLELSLRKLSLLYKHHDPRHLEEWDILYEILNREVNRKDETVKESEVTIVYALTGCFYLLLWARKYEGSNFNLKEMVNDFFSICTDLLVFNSGGRLAEEAFICSCDLLAIFEKIQGTSIGMEQLSKYMEEVVFSDENLSEMEVNNDEEGVEKIMKQR